MVGFPTTLYTFNGGSVGTGVLVGGSVVRRLREVKTEKTVLPTVSDSTHAPIVKSVRQVNRSAIGKRRLEGFLGPG